MARTKSAAELVLARMKALGVDYLFGNAGTDFPSIIEAFAQQAQSGLDLPEPVLAAHENVAVGMAHGYALATGRAQAVMVHVNVGLANAVMGLLNAKSDNVPVLMCSGRTPVTERGRHGGRSVPIHWGQEMRDQAAMIREAVKWDYELRYPEQGELVVERALALAHSDPTGPVYLSLPREVLASAAPEELPLQARARPARAGAPPADAVADAVALIAQAKNPIIIAQRPPAGEGAALIAALAQDWAIPVLGFWAARNVIATGHPMFAGADSNSWLEDADVVINIDAAVPWLIGKDNPGWNATVIGIGADPLFSAIPIRSFPVDVALSGDSGAALDALMGGLAAHRQAAAADIEARRGRVSARISKQRAAVRARAEKGSGAPMSAAWFSLCLNEAKQENAVVFNELGGDTAVMEFAAPNLLYTAPLSGGLGWGLPAALGYQLADRDRQVIACVGDGSYIFANPVACHLAAVAHKLPVLTVVFNNGIWNAVRRATLAMYPDGAAAKSNAMPLTQLTPAPDYAALARAHGMWGERVEDGQELPGALKRAFDSISRDRVPALLEVVTG